MPTSATWKIGALGFLLTATINATMATLFVCLRYDQQLNNFVILSAGALLCVPLIYPWASPLTIPLPSLGYLFLMGVVLAPISMGLITTAPKFITAAEVSLIMLLEMILSPLLVWLILEEVPPNPTLIGASILLAILVGHSLVSIIAADTNSR